MSFRTLKLRRDPNCVICGDHPTQKTLINYEQFCGVVPASQAATAGLPPEFETTVEELKAQLDRKDPIWILDVREPREFEMCRIPGSTLIPLGELPNRLAELPQGAGAPEIIVHCKMGGRSAKAVGLLRDRGFTRLKNLKGGILAYIDKVDPSQSKTDCRQTSRLLHKPSRLEHGGHGVWHGAQPGFEVLFFRRSFFEDLTLPKSVSSVSPRVLRVCF